MNFEMCASISPAMKFAQSTGTLLPGWGTRSVKKFTEERELTVMLVVDVSASGNFGSISQSKREFAAEVACLLAFSAIRNNDKVGLTPLHRSVELFIPPKKGRSHTCALFARFSFSNRSGCGTDPRSPWII